MKLYKVCQKDGHHTTYVCWCEDVFNSFTSNMQTDTGGLDVYYLLGCDTV
jgi:hypothetical protein